MIVKTKRYPLSSLYMIENERSYLVNHGVQVIELDHENHDKNEMEKLNELLHRLGYKHAVDIDIAPIDDQQQVHYSLQDEEIGFDFLITNRENRVVGTIGTYKPDTEECFHFCAVNESDFPGLFEQNKMGMLVLTSQAIEMFSQHHQTDATYFRDAEGNILGVQFPQTEEERIISNAWLHTNLKET